MTLEAQIKDETIKNSISSFVKMIYFDQKAINDNSLEFLSQLLKVNPKEKKDEHNLGLFCLFSISLYELKIEHLRKLDVITLLTNNLEINKYEKRVYALKIMINFMEISSLDKELLRENNFQLFDFLLYFTQSELQEEQRLATRGLSKLSLDILRDRNPRVTEMPHPEKVEMFPPAESPSQKQNDDQKTIKEDSSEESMTDKDESKSISSKDSDELDRENEKEEESKSAESAGNSDSSQDNKGVKSPKILTPNKNEANSSPSSRSDTSESDSQESYSTKSISLIASKGNIIAFLTSLSSKIKPRPNSDSDIQYFSLYSIFNLLLQTNIQSSDGPTMLAKNPNLPLECKHWNDLRVIDFNMLLIECQLVNNVIALLNKAKDEDIVRISLKIIILLTFKVQMKEFLTFDNSETGNKFWVMNCLSADTDNYNYYNFQSFLGYLLHRCSKESIDITAFLPVPTINQFLLKLCNDFREDELLELNSTSNQNASKKKIIIYKFFFVSYLVSLLIKTLDHKGEAMDTDVRLGTKQLCYNFIEICQSVRIQDMGLSKLLKQTQEETKGQSDRHDFKIEGRSSIIGVTVSLCMKSLYIEMKKSMQEQESADNDNILDKRSAQLLISADPKIEQLEALDKKICMLILNNLTKYEDVGEIVELTYKYLSCFFEDKTEEIKNQYTELLENSKVLVTQAVKHIAVYKSDNALKFLNLLIGASSKYKNKTEIDNALRNLMNNGRVIKK